ncbi:tol-pal system-associated acyl-CoA thioesterase [Thalassotalea piscium]|uniref:Acyl-CoA thioester hydrolase n=1 Tax=Thalassotalea piscium TaxID=1230533 RepID=A0A7X0TUP0_9GAMM|nr:tol-pal system-associated acyl-CoA thioesterase [Thalassotalea piscium]MBB6544349.1 acyl-CoA thioester hydrolase [Thalassotalea piscium]
MNDKHHIRVYYEDTDAGGIVYYANYLKFFERARTEFLRLRGINQSDFLEQNIGFVVRKVEMENLASAKLDDLLLVTSKICQLKGASIVFEQKIFTQSQILICTAKVRVACVNLALAKPCAIPEIILGALKRVS